MNESKNGNKTIITKVKPKYTKVLLKYVNEHPEGLRFKDMREALKIPDSTLSRNIDILTKEGSIVKVGNLYLPSGSDITLQTFRMAMSVIEEVVRQEYHEKNEKKHDENEKLKIALNEIVGKSGHPSPYQYYTLPSDDDLLTLIRLLKYTVSGSISGGEFEVSLSSFIARALRYRTEKGMNIKEPLVRIIREVEGNLFNERKILGSMERDDDIDSTWLNVYESLCLLEDKWIPVVLKRILDHAVNLDLEKLNKIKLAIRNKLWCHKLMDTLYNMQFELFQRQLKNSSNPDVSQFYGDLRRIAIDEKNTSEQSDKAREA